MAGARRWSTGRAGVARWLVTLVLLCAGIDAASTTAPPTSALEDTGSLRGRVTLGERIAAPPMRFSLYPDANRLRGRAEHNEPSEELSNVVVYLESVPVEEAEARRPSGPFRMEQRELTFDPHVLVVTKGTTVEFPNEDALFHNVFSLSKVASFDLGRYPRGSSRTVTFDRAGIVKVFCQIHSDMSGVIVVLDNPFFATPDGDGRFSIEGIPPGQYRVAAWHERARPSVKTVRIQPDRASVLDFSIPLEASDVD